MVSWAQMVQTCRWFSTHCWHRDLLYGQIFLWGAIKRNVCTCCRPGHCPKNCWSSVLGQSPILQQLSINSLLETLSPFHKVILQTLDTTAYNIPARTQTYIRWERSCFWDWHRYVLLNGTSTEANATQSKHCAPMSSFILTQWFPKPRYLEWKIAGFLSFRGSSSLAPPSLITNLIWTASQTQRWVLRRRSAR